MYPFQFEILVKSKEIDEENDNLEGYIIDEISTEEHFDMLSLSAELDFTISELPSKLDD